MNPLSLRARRVQNRLREMGEVEAAAREMTSVLFIEEEEDDDNIVPVSLSAHVREANSAEFLRRVERIVPVVEAWLESCVPRGGRASPIAGVDATEVAVEGVAVRLVGTEADDADVIGKLLEHATGRSAFTKVLNRWRSIQQDVGAAFDRLAAVMLRFLDCCEAQGDVTSCKMLMVMVSSSCCCRCCLLCFAAAASDRGGCRCYNYCCCCCCFCR